MLKKLLEELSPEFGINEDMSPIDQDISGKLERSAKLDEIDTVTFGLETDDNKIVKVYVKAEQAEDFEKALADKLGEVDDIEECLNLLANDFEIVDVEWPEDASNKEDSEYDSTETGKNSLDQKVYDNDKENSMEKDIMKPNLENLNLGEKTSLSLTEDASSVEARMITPFQLLVYHGILELGMPAIALDKSPYRAAIIKGIKDKALEISRNAAMKIALKNFISKSVSDDEDKKSTKHGDLKGKNLESEIRDELHKRSGGKVQKESLDESPKVEWKFDKDTNSESVIISAEGFPTISLDVEETEKVVKSLTNKETIVVKDQNDPAHKIVFSPRGINVLIKKVGTSVSFKMTSKDVDDLLTFIGKMDQDPDSDTELEKNK